MRDVYVGFGPECPSIVALVGLVANVTAIAFASIKRKRLTYSAFYLISSVIYLLALWTPIPFTWVLGSAFILFAGAFLAAKSTTKKDQVIKNAVGGTFLVLGIGIVAIGPRDMLTLTEDTAAYTGFGYSVTVPRKGLQVHATGSPGFFNQGWSWTSYSGNSLGPDIDGTGVYYGPKGVMRGDGVGLELAEWAGTKPRYQTFAATPRHEPSATISPGGEMVGNGIFADQAQRKGKVATTSSRI